MALRYAGRPAFDGVEIDIALAPGGTCVLAHDPDATDEAPPAAAALAIIEEHLQTASPVSFHSDAFILKVELKPPTDSAAVEQLADCTAATVSFLVTNNSANLEVIFDSRDPAVLRSVAAILAELPATGVDYRLSAGFGSTLNTSLRDFDAPLDVVSVHAETATNGFCRAARALDLQLMFWTRLVSVETFAAIEERSPDYVSAGNVVLLQEWLAR